MLTPLYKALLALCVAVLVLLTACKPSQKADSDGVDSTRLAPVAFDANRAYADIERQCAFGPRVPNSAAHDSCAAWIADRFRSLGLTVTEQKATLTGWDGQALQCNNIMAAYKPDAPQRIVLCAHWDSRPWADEDPDTTKRRTPVLAANDGASGVAVLLELARLLPQLNPRVGVDFVCFDAEDYGAPEWGTGADDGSDWCLGSQYWAAHLPDGYKPRYGILLDMVGGQDARFPVEYFSAKYAPDVVARIWTAAQTTGNGTLFPQQDGGGVQDDHLPMNQTAGIPTADIVSNAGNTFSATWHTTYDTPQNISRDVLQAVGQTLLQVLFEEE